MQVILNDILDIDPNDPTVKELNELASKYGINTVLEAVVEVSEFFGKSGLAVANLDLTTYRPLVRKLLSIAIINYASSIYSEFFLEVLGETQKPRIYQSNDPEIYRQTADKNLRRAKDLIRSFES